MNRKNRRDELNSIFRQLTTFFQEDAVTLVEHLRTEHRYSNVELARVLGISEKRVRAKFPKGAK